MVKTKKAPAALIFRACLRCVCIWSAVITAPSRSSSGIFPRSWRKTGISFVFGVDRELGGGGAVVPDPGQQHRRAPAAGSGAAQRLAVDPQVAAHAGPQRPGPGTLPRAQRVVVLALVTAGESAADGAWRPGGAASRPGPAARPA